MFIIKQTTTILNWSLIFGVSLAVGNCYCLYKDLSIGDVVLSQLDTVFSELNRLTHLTQVYPVSLVFYVLNLSCQQLLNTAMISRFTGNVWINIHEHASMIKHFILNRLSWIWILSTKSYGKALLPGNGRTTTGGHIRRLSSLSSRRS